MKRELRSSSTSTKERCVHGLAAGVADVDEDTAALGITAAERFYAFKEQERDAAG